MIKEKLYFWLNGKVEFSVSDGFCDRFLERCKNDNIELFNVTVQNEKLHGTVLRKDVALLKNAADKSGMSVIINKRSGLPFIFFRYSKRYGIPLGVLLFAIIVRLLSLMLWSVDITGNDKVTTETVMSVLEECGVHEGVFVSSLQRDDIEFALYERIEDILWVSVFNAGSRLFVDIREKNEVQEITDSSAYSNIVAAKDGEVISADIYVGEGKILPGTPVVKGDLLVNGVVTFSDGSVKFVNSEADITARTKNTVSSASAMSINAEKVSECKEYYFLDVFGLNVFEMTNDKYNNFTDSRYMCSAGDVIFPLGVVRRTSYSLETASVGLTEEQALLLAFSDFAKASFGIYKNTEVYDRTLSVTVAEQVFVEGIYLCEENIALEKRITVEDTNDITHP